MTQQRPLVIFLDANILFSAAYGSPALERLWDEATRGRYLMIASHYVVEKARRNLDTANHRIALEKCLSPVRLVPEADPGIPCPIPLPEKVDCPQQPDGRSDSTEPCCVENIHLSTCPGYVIMANITSSYPHERITSRWDVVGNCRLAVVILLIESATGARPIAFCLWTRNPISQRRCAATPRACLSRRAYWFDSPNWAD